jgi:uncharacterized membrane protein YfcA
MDLVTGSALAVLVVAFGVGIVVGLTGMGGGALMTPALIFLGINPAVAVANDLVAASVNKSVGAAVHWRQRLAQPAARPPPDDRLRALRLRRRLHRAPPRRRGRPGEDDHHHRLRAAARRRVVHPPDLPADAVRGPAGNVVSTDEPEVRALPTILVGAFGGLLVGITSVGSGSLIMVALLLLFPTLSALKLVGTDLVQAVPLVSPPRSAT